MTEEQTGQLLELLAQFDYQGDFADAMRLGEVPWKANLAALRSLDIELDAKKGEADVKRLLSSVEKLLSKLKELERAAGQVKRGATSLLR